MSAPADNLIHVTDRSLHGPGYPQTSEMVHCPQGPIADHFAVYKTLISGCPHPGPHPPLSLSEGWLVWEWSDANVGPWSEGTVGGRRLQVEVDGSRGRSGIRSENCWQLDLSSLARAYLSRHRRSALSAVTAARYWCWLGFVACSWASGDVMITTLLECTPALTHGKRGEQDEKRSSKSGNYKAL